MRTALIAILTALAIAGAVGIVVQLPKIVTHHINLPKERRRREMAARRTLMRWMAGAAAVVAAVAWLLSR